MIRVTFSQINDTVQRNLMGNLDRLSGLQEQLSSGRRLNRPSDDPVDMKNNINLKAELAQGGQFHRNIDDGKSWISVTEVAMNDMNELIQRARELTIQAANDTNTGRERGFIASEINQLIKQLVSLSNTTYKGNYIFGGTRGNVPIYEYTEGTTFSFTAPLNAPGTANAMIQYTNRQSYQFKRLDPDTVSVVIDPTGVPINAVEGQDYEVDYAQGTITVIAGGALDGLAAGTEVQVTFNHYDKVNRENGGSILREIEEGVKPRVNVSADELFEDKTNNLEMIGVLVDLMDGLLNNESPKINNAIGEIDQIAIFMRSTQSKNGALLNRFDLTLDRNENRDVEITRLQSQLEDLDFAEAIMQFSQAENIYNASLRAGAKVILPTLGDYI